LGFFRVLPGFQTGVGDYRGRLHISPAFHGTPETMLEQALAALGRWDVNLANETILLDDKNPSLWSL